MRQWLSVNWDKIFGTIVVILLSGVVGFYTSLMNSAANLSRTNERLVSTEEKILELDKKITKIDDHEKIIDDLSIRIACMNEKNNEFSRWIDEFREVRRMTETRLYDLKLDVTQATRPKK